MKHVTLLEKEAEKLRKKTRIGDKPRSWFCFLGIFAAPATKEFLFLSDWYGKLENPAFHSHMTQWLMFTTAMLVIFVFFSRFFELVEEDASIKLEGVEAKIKVARKIASREKK